MKKRVIITEKAEQKLRKGFLWIYDNEILKIEGEPSPGDIVSIHNANRSFLGKGYINPRSKITIRILTRKDEEINRDFLKNRIVNAWEYRQKIINSDSFRVVFSEADLLPGLIVDKFKDILVLQILTLGVERFKEQIADVLNEIFNPRGIYERNDISTRELEGLPQVKGFLKGPFETQLEIEENGLRILVDVENGQKTGYFLDQNENRKALKGLVEGAEVLDAFCYTGGFSLHALKYGAKNVVAIDSSKKAIELAKENAKLNGFENKIEFIEDNAFDILRKFHKSRKTFDVVILDPPSFVKSQKNLEGAIKGYKEINLRAMKILRDGGFLITCSCSHHITPTLFQQIIESAAVDANKILRLVELRYQSKDHPILLSHPETLYLKCGIYQVLKKP
ncbi:MAG: class I SAM-dependent rRNA methyltransferase [Synergistetes bacterium]|nr:class I SAM-dependent rRNA methyltransferase [Synergistota bacterium]MCX8127900.1 class I SAM-dependent rRNA methyltransferase [Synergistota bacterium]MDW8192162.1 class I SAM-dependent rRNA methyltransferase [Synergistota bacterium]